MANSQFCFAADCAAVDTFRRSMRSSSNAARIVFSIAVGKSAPADDVLARVIAVRSDVIVSV